MPAFVPGSIDPSITPDPGAGKWNTESYSADTLAFREAFFQFWLEAVVLIGDDAVKHMYHYFENDGADYTIDLEGMVAEVPTAKLLFEREVASAKLYVEGLAQGPFTFTSRRASNGYNGQHENRNWFFAIGGYSVWAKGTGVVSRDAAGRRSYEMRLEYKFFDRYNWDGGKSVTLFGVKITDKFMGRMHREGMAQEFNCYGSLTRVYKWDVGKPLTLVASGSGGR